MEFRIYDEILLDSGKMPLAKGKNKGEVKRIIGSKSDICVEKLYLDNAETAQKAKKYVALSYNFKSLVENDEGDVLAKHTATELKKIISEYGYSVKSPLVIGLGNKNIQADSLGVRVTDNISSSTSKIMTFNPSIESLTGYPSFDAISAMTTHLKPSIIFIVDTLSAKNVNRLGSFIQISNKGISAGSGVANSQPTLSHSSLSIPVIALGVPLVIYAKTILMNFVESCDINSDQTSHAIHSLLNGNETSYIVAPTSVNLCLEVLSDVLSTAINSAVS